MLGKNAGERILRHHYKLAAARDIQRSPAYGHFPPSEGRKTSLSPVTRWKLPLESVAEDDARVHANSVNFIPAVRNHEG
jgi:hypothetical protein